MIITGDYRIRRMNALNILLEKESVISSGKNEGDITWKTVGHFNDYEKASAHLVHILIADHTPDEDDAKVNTARALNRKLNEVHRLVMEEIKETIEYRAEEVADAERKPDTE